MPRPADAPGSAVPLKPLRRYASRRHQGRGLSPDVVQQPRQLVVEDVADHVRVDPEALVDNHVAKSGDRGPRRAIVLIA